jgi:CubicO group peptidase (beta-lactamase class C family)
MTRLPTTGATALLAAALSGCLADEPLKRPLDLAPRTIASDWPVSTPEAQGMDPQDLARAYELFASADRFQTARSLLVVRNGVLVAEAYPRDERHLHSLQHVKSVSKSVTSLLFGIARDQGRFPDLDAPLHQSLPRELRVDADKQRITLRHALTMRSGIDYLNDVQTTELMTARPASSLQFVLDRPLRSPPGARFHYHDGDPHLVGAAIQASTGQDLLEFARRNLFEPIGIREARWERHRDGAYYAAYGVWLRPRDMARIGQLVLQKGVWDGRRVVSEEWLALSTAVLVNQAEAPYGMYWWVRPGVRALSAAGHGGQYIYVVPGKRLVIVMTAEPYTHTSDFGVRTTEIEELIHWIDRAAR